MEKLKLHTPDLTASNIDKLAQLFPNCVTEARDEAGRVTQAIDFDQLRQELSGSIVEGPQEHYLLDWPGKQQSVLKSNEPTTDSLRPARAESTDFTSTGNVFIEGENLIALKLLQETYLGEVDLIYIDPPYNTGSDLLYNDHFKEEEEGYLIRSGQTDDSGDRLMTNPESNGRFHSDWLTMLYPRLRLARNLLRESGVILISIDDHELSNATKLCEMVFGASNFIATLVWEKGRKNDARLFSVGHEYVLVFAKSLAALKAAKAIWREEKPGAREIWDKFVELRGRFAEDYRTIEIGLQKWFADLLKTHPSKKWSRYKHADKHGPWRDGDISWPGGGGPRYDVIHPKTKKPCAVPERGWVFAQPETMQKMIELGIVEFRDDHTEPPFRKQHIRPIVFEIEALAEIDDEAANSGEETEEDELATQVRGSYFYKQSQSTVKFLRNLMGAKVFDNPKDHFELARLFEYVTSGKADALILDFFAGSASTAHAVMHLNCQNGGQRRFILVQLPQPLDPEKKEQKAAAKYCDSIGRPRTIAEIAKERMRRAGAEITSAASEKGTKVDTGFRVLKIDKSNMRDVYYAPDALAQGDLLAQVDNIRPHRTPEDLLFQVLVDWGLDLALPIAQETIAGKSAFFVDGNALAACFDTGITDELVKEVAKRKPLRAVFRDSSYGSDSVKINMDQIFRLLSPDTEVRSI
jgi:adenine-specific DNA-methyltransferase